MSYDKKLPKIFIDPHQNMRKSFQELCRIKETIRKTLPALSTLREDRLVQLAHLDMKKSDKLAVCTHESICASIVACAQLGLEPGVSGHIYLIPRWKSDIDNGKDYQRGRFECTVMLGYRGMIELSFRSERVSSFEAACVYENDKFYVRRGTNPEVFHEEAIVDRSEIFIGAYAIATLKNGTKQFEWMNAKAINKIRDRSPSKADYKDPNCKGGTVGPWVTDFDEMAKKTVLRRLLKVVPSSVDMDHAMYLDEAAERGEAGMHKRGTDILAEAPGRVIEGEFETQKP